MATHFRLAADITSFKGHADPPSSMDCTLIVEASRDVLQPHNVRVAMSGQDDEELQPNERGRGASLRAAAGATRALLAEV